MQALIASPDRSSWNGRPDHALLVVALRTGLRLSELTGLCLQDADLGPAAHLSCLGKGRKRRDMPLDKPTAALLRAWLDERQGGPDDAPSRRGTRLSPDAVQRLVAKHANTAQACAARRSAHNLRHSCAMDQFPPRNRPGRARHVARTREARFGQRLHPRHPTLKQRALDRRTPTTAQPGRYRPPDQLLAFLEGL